MPTGSFRGLGDADVGGDRCTGGVEAEAGAGGALGLQPRRAERPGAIEDKGPDR